MRLLSTLCFLGWVILSQLSFAQGVTIGSNNPPDPAAVLDLQSSQSGLLLPRLTTAQRNGIQNPPNALVIYNTDNHCVETYFPGGWKPVQCDCTNPPAQASISGPNVVCTSADSVWIYTTGVQGASTYTWTIDNQDTLVSGQGTDSIMVHFSGQGGSRNIGLVAGNACGNSATASFSIQVSPADTSFSITPFPINVNNQATFSANANGGSYVWTFQNGTPASSVAQSPQVTWSQTGQVQVSLTVTDANGCTGTNDSLLTITNCQPQTWTFSNCGQTGRIGPSQAQCNSSYGPGVVTVNNGIQNWTVPATGSYTIRAAGAEGGDKQDYQNNGGEGQIVEGTVTLNAGDVLSIVVGQLGGQAIAPNQSGGGGGGGGSFVYNANSQVLYVAAGGGGGIGAGNSTRKPGRTASTAQNSGTQQQDNNNGPSTYTYNAPTGNGGGSYGGVIGQGDYDSGGGAGWNGNGMDGVQYSGTEGGRSRAGGWLGGNYSSARQPYVAVGGFGGGGGASDGGGGGGGYTGGNGGRWNSLASGGGGGTCYVINNTNPSSLGTKTGHGEVVITRTCP